MKKLVGIFCVWIFLSFLSFPIRAEEISSFDAKIVISKEGMTEVEEAILYNFGNEQRHGIFRTIPLTKTNKEGKTFAMKMTVNKVLDLSGNPYNFSKSSVANGIQLKIGDANKTLTGSVFYDIFYTIDGSITYFSDHDELYWNVVGTEWTVPINKTSVLVSLPQGVSKESITQTCFVGTEGQNVPCEGVVTDKDVTFQYNQPLLPGQGLTIVVGFPKGTVLVREPEVVHSSEPSVWAGIIGIVFLLFGIFWYIGLPIWIVVRWWKHGRDPKPPMGIAHAWFSPPTDAKKRSITPGEVGTLVDERADTKDVVATVVDLARRGYITIVETKKNDITLKKIEKKKSGTLEIFEEVLLHGIFDKRKSIRLKDTSIVSTVTDTKNKLYEKVVQDGFFVENPDKVRTRYIILGTFAVVTINFPLALAAFIFGTAMPKKTIAGAQARAIADALKNFLTSQDRQLAYQAKNQMMFEKLLPYAIVFGVEKIWAERFKDMDLSKPSWYEGSYGRGFNSVVFVNSLSSSVNTMTSSMTPTSSSSGFSSGFSGGSVGGGGGGGGGGSW